MTEKLELGEARFAFAKHGTSDLLCKINAGGSTEYNWPLIEETAAKWQPYDTDLIRCMAKLLLPLKPKQAE